MRGGALPWIALVALSAGGLGVLAGGLVVTGAFALLAAMVLAAWLAGSNGGGDPPVRVVALLAGAWLSHVTFKALRLYKWGEWDTLQHFAIPFVLGLLGFALARRLAAGAASERASDAGAAVVTFLAVVALATLWEVWEFTTDMTLGTRAQHGLFDTMLDLTAGALAALLSALVGVGLRRGGGLERLGAELEPVGRAIHAWAATEGAGGPGRSQK